MPIWIVLPIDDIGDLLWKKLSRGLCSDLARTELKECCFPNPIWTTRNHYAGPVSVIQLFKYCAARTDLFELHRAPTPFIAETHLYCVIWFITWIWAPLRWKQAHVELSTYLKASEPKASLIANLCCSSSLKLLRCEELWDRNSIGSLVIYIFTLLWWRGSKAPSRLCWPDDKLLPLTFLGFRLELSTVLQSRSYHYKVELPNAMW